MADPVVCLHCDLTPDKLDTLVHGDVVTHIDGEAMPGTWTVTRVLHHVPFDKPGTVTAVLTNTRGATWELTRPRVRHAVTVLRGGGFDPVASALRAVTPPAEHPHVPIWLAKGQIAPAGDVPDATVARLLRPACHTAGTPPPTTPTCPALAARPPGACASTTRPSPGPCHPHPPSALGSRTPPPRSSPGRSARVCGGGRS